MTDSEILGKLHDASIEMQRAIDEALKRGSGVPARFFQSLLNQWRRELKRIEEKRMGAGR